MSLVAVRVLPSLGWLRAICGNFGFKARGLMFGF